MIPGENEALEFSNSQKKAELKATKAEIEAMKEEAVKLAKLNSERKCHLDPQNPSAS